ncbi:glycerol kinase GlpK [Sphingomonas sp. CGMCC 1.13654]|uniref:Glycerol kinase n=1 Tax=Sphingomonas chungangi TaxID=2683589 RepID=A0A838L5U9_9SPHN|nr:glycerol kinase GlpK [Sphingomonas chungangi]MBA2934075.1 glycerol kinase GlpK [Sphingomonas chungangi]MVW57116.1 glycerol kinase GlpK [Sphingomonas chungangi]
MTRHILAIDQGTTSTRAIVFDDRTRVAASAQAEFAQHYPQAGWVEHDPEDIWRDTLATMKGAIGKAGLQPADIAAIGITNQRETAVLWDRATGRPVHNAIVWQDRRGAPLCARLKEEGKEALVRAKTGLLLDPYFSASKLAWLFDEVEGLRERAEAGELAFGTIDCFLLWRLTGGKVHATDATNASRTLLFDIHAQDWDDELLALFGLPRAILPDVRDNAGLFGETDPDLLGVAIPIAGMAGDQQAAVVGQACFEVGSAKSTYGTGCFLLLNTGAEAITSDHRLLTTVAYRLDGRPTYALEGSIFVAGAAVKWLRDGLGLITHASQTDDMATRTGDNGGVYMVPAFVGLGAPHWEPDARGLITGLTLGTTAAHIARAALEAVAYQTHDLAEAMEQDGAAKLTALRVDGGMAANDWLCQFLADLLDLPVERPAMLETTALGAACLAGIGIGLWDGPEAVAALDRALDRFEPHEVAADRRALLDGWRKALRQALTD